MGVYEFLGGGLHRLRDAGGPEIEVALTLAFHEPDGNGHDREGRGDLDRIFPWEFSCARWRAWRAGRSSSGRGHGNRHS